MRTKILSAFFFLSFITLTLQAETKKIVFIHTNDTHSQIEPTSKSASKDPDMGGILRRKALIDSIECRKRFFSRCRRLRSGAPLF